MGRQRGCLATLSGMPEHFWIETLGCPKNRVDSDKIAGSLIAQGLIPASSPSGADLVVVNTCAFIDQAREESIAVIDELASVRRPGARLTVTGCLAARAGAELAEAMPEIDVVADVGVPVAFSTGPRWRSGTSNERTSLLDLPRSASAAPWAYVKIAEGCDRACGFCAIPTFRGKQVSRTPESILTEIDRLEVAEVVLVAQDLASYGNDRGERGALVPLVRAVAARVPRVRLLYLYPSSLTDELCAAVIETGVPYFDLSLQHVSRAHLRRMRRFGHYEAFLERIDKIRSAEPRATFRSSFILGYPGETEEDHDLLLRFLEEAQLDWVGLFPYSREEGTYAAASSDQVSRELALERLRECAELQDTITATRRRRLIGSRLSVLVDEPGRARSVHEAPEIDGIIEVDAELAAGSFAEVEITDALGPDLIGALLEDDGTSPSPR